MFLCYTLPVLNVELVSMVSECECVCFPDFLSSA